MTLTDNLSAGTGLKPGHFGHPAIDCDVHIAVPSTQTLMPYLDAYWYDAFATRGINRLSFNMTGDAPAAPLAGRPDWRPKDGRPGSDPSLLRKVVFEDFGSSLAIANCIFGGIAVHSEDLAAVMAKAVNDWVTEHWLDKIPGLRASIVVPLNSVDLALEEIERRAGDSRFVQILMLAMGENLLGKRSHWPIYKAAEKAGLPICVHAGSLYHHPPMAGWGSFAYEDYVAQSFSFENQVLSLVSEGVFQKFPNLKFVFAESGVTWLPACLWRFNKTWRGVRPEIPWVKSVPADIVRDHIRFSLQPFDAPDGQQAIERWMTQMKSDRMILFSTDFPHWHFEGRDALPFDASSSYARRILFENALDTYPRLHAQVKAPEAAV